MLVTKSQFFVLFACIAFGGVSAVLFSFASIFKKFINNKVIKSIFDIFAFVLISLLFAVYSHILSFPSLRAYMIVGVFLGITCYVKSFHLLLAKIVEIIYNICVRKIHKFKKVRDD